MKKEFTKPVIEISAFSRENIITGSGSTLKKSMENNGYTVTEKSLKDFFE